VKSEVNLEVIIQGLEWEWMRCVRMAWHGHGMTMKRGGMLGLLVSRGEFKVRGWISACRLRSQSASSYQIKEFIEGGGFEAEGMHLKIL